MQRDIFVVYGTRDCAWHCLTGDEENCFANFVRRERREWIRYETWSDCCTSVRRLCDVATRSSKYSKRHLRSATPQSVTFRMRSISSGRSSIWDWGLLPSILIKDWSGKPYRRNLSEATRNRWWSSPSRKGRLTNTLDVAGFFFYPSNSRFPLTISPEKCVHVPFCHFYCYIYQLAAANLDSVLFVYWYI